MSGLSFDFEWVDIPGQARDEVRATMASLRISIANRVLTEVYDRRSRSVRERLVVPLYPVAEWVAAHWWRLLEESRTPGRDSETAFRERHSLASAGDGFALPDVMIVSRGSHVDVNWGELSLEHQPLRFTERGEAVIAAEQLRETLCSLVVAVLGRLADRGVQRSWLADEWQAIVSASPEEREFCRAMAWLGGDPYDPPENTADEVIALASCFRPELFEELLRALSSHEVRAGASWVQDGLAAIQDKALVSHRWETLYRDAPAPGGESPWREGYRMAAWLRRTLKADQVPFDLNAIVDGVFPLFEAPKGSPRGIDGLVASPSSERFCCSTPKSRPESQRFLGARGVGFLLYDPRTRNGIVSGTLTEKQQFSRAFAAELLAPADLLRKRISSDRGVTTDDIDDWAEEFQVSAAVIGHQIQNHRLASVSDAGLSPHEP